MPSQKEILDKARSIGQKIDTLDKAKESITLVQNTLHQTIAALNEFGFVNKATGVHDAWAYRINSQLDWLMKVSNELFEEGLKPTVANKIGLQIIQSAQLLGDLRKAIEESQRGIISQIIEDFVTALKQVLDVALEAARKAAQKTATAIWPLALVGLAIGGAIALARK